MDVRVIMLVLGGFASAHVVQANPVAADACSIKVNGDLLMTHQPLFLKPNGTADAKGFLQPSKQGIISLAAGDKLLLACPGDNNYLLPLKGVNETIATCVRAQNFTVGDKTLPLRNLSCASKAWHVLERTNRTCYNGSEELELGFRTAGRFYALIVVCFNNRTRGALYSHAVVVAGIGGSQTGVARPDFKTGGMYPNISPEKLYKRQGQRNTVATLLGSQKLADQYISNTSDYFLSRGHLVAKVDFVFGPQQDATFYYPNAAPQWQTFNSGNWEVLESNVRNLASTMGEDLHVYTGTHGLATLLDVNNNETPLYLHVNGTTRGIPVPLLFWKVVYHNASQSGAAFLGVNNPYANGTLLPKPPKLCKDVCSQIKWITWTQDNVKRGLSYCCEVDDFRKVVTALPAFPVKQLLMNSRTKSAASHINLAALLWLLLVVHKLF